MEKQAPLPGYEASRIPLHGCISLNERDKIRVMSLCDAGLDTVRQAILASWPFGIQREREYGSSFEFKLKGNPWSGQGVEAIPCRVLMMAILRALYDIGHVIYLSTDLSRKQFDKDSIFFRWHSVPPPPCIWFAISFNMGDTIRVIEAPPHLVPQFRQLLGSRIQRETAREYNTIEFKLRGYPFLATGTDTVETRMLFLRILDILAQNNFVVYASIDQSVGSGGESQGETDSLYIKSL